MDVLEIDAATHTGVDNVREVVIEGLAITPVRNRYKVFIIDEVHMLSARLSTPCSSRSKSRRRTSSS